jgi:hypothetical protein
MNTLKIFVFVFVIAIVSLFVSSNASAIDPHDGNNLARVICGEELNEQKLNEPKTAEGNANAITWSLSSGWTSCYILPNGAIATVSNVDCIQSKLTASFKNGAYVSAFHSLGLNDDNWDSDYADEFDPINLGWAGKIKDVGVDAGVAYWDLHRIFGSPKEDTIYPYINLNKEYAVSKEHTLVPYLGFAFPFPAKSGLYDSGVYIFTGLGHNWAVNNSISLAHKAGIIYDDGACKFDHGYLFNYELYLNYKVNDNLTWNALSLRVVSPLSSFDDYRDGTTSTAVGSGITWTF